jgi:hypothetical protein
VNVHGKAESVVMEELQVGTIEDEELGWCAAPPLQRGVQVQGRGRESGDADGLRQAPREFQYS